MRVQPRGSRDNALPPPVFRIVPERRRNGYNLPSSLTVRYDLVPPPLDVQFRLIVLWQCLARKAGGSALHLDGEFPHSAGQLGPLAGNAAIYKQPLF